MNQKIPRRSTLAVSNAVFAGTVVVLVIIAVAGFGLYTTSTRVSTTTSIVTQTVTSTVTPLKSAGFLNASLVTFGYSSNYACTPPMNSFGFNSTETTNAAKFTGCEVGAGNSSAVSGAFPVFVLVPAYAGLSIFGVTSLGASPQGYPVFN